MLDIEARDPLRPPTSQATGGQQVVAIVAGLVTVLTLIAGIVAVLTMIFALFRSPEPTEQQPEVVPYERSPAVAVSTSGG